LAIRNTKTTEGLHVRVEDDAEALCIEAWEKPTG